MRGRGRGRGRNNSLRNQNDESTQLKCNICKRSSHVEKIIGLEGNPNVIIAKSLITFKKIVGTK